MAAGLLLVVATVMTFWQVDLRRHAGEQFLAVARPVPAGVVIAEADVRVVRVANPSDLDLLAADRRDEVVGRAAAVPLAAGTLLAPAQVGPSAWPPTGQAVIAVAVKTGRAPAGLAAGARVVVLVGLPASVDQAGGGSPPAGQAAQTRRAMASVVSASEAEQGGQVVTLLLSVQEAETVASASGDVALVQLRPDQ
ncbi:SAF domain-containing protein [Micromonospora sp. WMMD980]|uniref:SAF domain-containing protein n=1 Tax=Micromonospora sp. WMMD980 TaxID=3016088 RepID=UPI0024178F71|nr:SAF domain-containing protein [Micromonospora sp. WMMD980]MDG4803620.1 SAF domain-containing protein [Micromonospora sp. WMMD980]